MSESEARPLEPNGGSRGSAANAGDAYRLLFDGNPIPMWVFDEESLHILAVNDAAVRTYGYSREEFLRMTMSELRPSEDAPALDAGVQTGSPVPDTAGVWLHRRRDGSIFHVEVAAHSLPFDGRVARLVVAKDVTERLKIELRAREAEETYRTLIERIPAVTYFDLIDPERGRKAREAYVSPQVEALLGYTPAEIVADPSLWERLLHPEDRDRALAEASSRYAAGEPLDQQYRMMTRDGRVVWVRDRSAVVRDEEGGSRFALGVITDITGSKEAEERIREAEARYRNLVEQIPGVAYSAEVGPRGEWKYVAPQVESMLGYTPEEFMADPGLWFELIHPEDRDRVLAEEKREVAGASTRPVPIEYRMMARDGRVVWVQDQAYVIRDQQGRPLHFQGVLFDITELKRAEEAQREAYERMRSLNELKDAFLSAVSHELRTPLAAVLGFAITLNQEGVDRSSEEGQEMLERLIANATKLERLLSDLLDVDRLTRGAADLLRTWVDVGALVRRVVEETEVGGRSIHLDIHRVMAEVDAPKVERVVENLLANATRHTPVGTAIRVAVRPEAEGVLISVDDEGPGVPAELRDHLFRPFERGPEVPTHAPGTGIGLSLVAGFAKLHGGRAWVEEHPGGGASFRVSLPRRASRGVGGS